MLYWDDGFCEGDVFVTFIVVVALGIKFIPYFIFKGGHAPEVVYCVISNGVVFGDDFKLVEGA